MMRTGGGCDFITRIWTEEVCVRSKRDLRPPSPRPSPPGEGELSCRSTCKVEGVLGVAGGMVGGGVQRVEAMIFVLNLRAVGDGEAELAEARTMSSVTCVSGWAAERAAAAGNVKSVGSLGSAALRFEFGAAFGERGFEGDFGGVDEFAGGGLFCFRQRASCSSAR